MSGSHSTDLGPSFVAFIADAYAKMRESEGGQFSFQYRQHADAVSRLRWATSAFLAHRQETAVGLMLIGWLAYRDAHAERHEHDIRHDGVLGDPWKAIGHALQALLNGDTGRLDSQSVNSCIDYHLGECEDPAADIDDGATAAQ